MSDSFAAGGARDATFFLASLRGDGAIDAVEAIALVGGTIIAHVALNAAVSHMAGIFDADPAGLNAPVIVLDVTGADEDLLHEVVAAADAIVVSRGARLVIGLDLPQIDPVAAALRDGLGSVQLLCESDQAEWISAIVIAAVRDTGLFRSADEERQRLAQLHEEVARIADMLARLSGRDDHSDRAKDRRLRFALPPIALDLPPRAVRDVIRARRMRDRFLGEGLFEDPAWDMLLDLFAARLERRRVSVSSLCIAAAVAPTTALRWIAKLTARGMLVRSPDDEDRRRSHIALSDESAAAMQRYVHALTSANLPLV